MFDIGGVELLIIAVVAIIVVGPKDLPGLLRRVGKVVTKARNMAGEFKSHFDEVADQEEFKEIREGLESVKGLSPTNQIKEAMSPFEDAGSSLKESFGGMDEALPPMKTGKKKASKAKKTSKKTTKTKAASKSSKTASSPSKVKAKKAPKKVVRKTPAKKTAKTVEKAGA